ncbi:MAG TPA: 2-oxoglutarate dehydrogenase complex dihydrolipoyllysine-residue succinyltransferase [Hyphomicrobiaceae bacterium]|nr:2-oxoglutarate dehydrogenase complex dihydrolipoyllysine-residue succinyltransferase [Hyphomicrobiaceae bacterium]
MAIDIKVPTLGESVTEATLAKWFKKAGEAVAVDEPLCELETDKVTVEVSAPANGVLAELAVDEGATVAVGTVIGRLNEGGAPAAKEPAPAKAAPATAPKAEAKAPPKAASASSGPAMPPSPAAGKLMKEKGLSENDVAGSGKRGQVLKEDVLVAEAKPDSRPKSQPAPAAASTTVAYAPSVPAVAPQQMRLPSAPNDEAREERVRMTRLRQTIARRLKDAQNTAAMLTTFNDVDMSAVMGLRNQYKDLFEKRHGVKLGFMSFFVKACIQALKEIPAVNAEIDGADVIYKNYYHIGVAVGTEKGLVVPVVREADRMNLAEIEAKIADFGRRARDGKLSIDEMQGGTFTISNGGVYGSLMSTPILNAPQSGILGMHKIEERAVVRNGQIVIRPMMYLALSYDHRIVDGREAVTFLVRVKECLEDPQRFVLEL